MATTAICGWKITASPGGRFQWRCPTARAEPMTPHTAKIRALLVDDEPLARSNLRFLLRQDPAIESIAEASSGAEAVAEIRTTRPDLVFLDVQMPECGGVDVVEILKSDGALPVIVFVTAYDEYALRAFDAGALDYLLKPFDDARFALALQRAKERLAVRSASGICVRTFFAAFTARPSSTCAACARWRWTARANTRSFSRTGRNCA